MKTEEVALKPATAKTLFKVVSPPSDEIAHFPMLRTIYFNSFFNRNLNYYSNFDITLSKLLGVFYTTVISFENYTFLLE